MLKNGSVYPRRLSYCIRDSDHSVLTNGSIPTLDVDGNSKSQLSILVKQLQLNSYGKHNLTTVVWEEQKSVSRTKASQGDSKSLPQSVQGDDKLFRATHTTIVVVSPGWVSLLPPLVTLFMSVLLGQVAVSLLVGIWCGASIVSNGDVFTALLRTFDQYWVNAFTVNDHAGVLLFTLVLGGTIGVVQKGGGGHGLAIVAKQFMTSSLRMQLSTWLLCIAIFFDDYSCILIVGSSLRQVLSQTGVSREKFAAIIHTVGVCLPSMSPVSSWIGVEVGYLAAQLRGLELDWDPFVTCLSCLHYRFFPILFIAFIFITTICEKDFGPMVQFEKDAAASPINNGPMTPDFPGPMDSPKPELGPLEPDSTKPLRWQNAVVPFLAIAITTFVGMIFDGFDRLYAETPNESFTILDAMSHCDSVSSLIRASAAGWVIAVTMLLLQRIITLNEATKAWMEGVKDILEPTLTLTLAWALGSAIGEVSTAPFIASVVGDSIPKQILPAIACLLCYVVSFAVGSSFGTMAIMFPIIAPLSWSISGGDADNLRQCFGSILGGSVFGNTCSPIADTSILASLSAHVSLENHVRSILPYAVLVAVVSVIGGSLPIGMKICSTFTAFGICLAVLLLVVFFCGTRVNMRYRSLSSCSFLSVSPPMRYEGEIQPLLSA
ncbi:na:h antiporter family protein [Plasmopara halstedii]|uniref:Na:h antiporter family protein n=1 Tax=Plasmopara halstedii TaxID=4781 RepID=A0A0N7L5N6_PLAHL|nr:na:h antiporter family protein [Plasmopara halstedii]CEG41979.1 na:h antiporter family protein [Plasmopara halstedii]|eukprot:XP_024578348.1 na:h antiporter family protein [Plasmopara halstedii]